jgi:hypothetical protein
MAESPDHMSCQELVELVTGYLERELPADETALFEQHLNFCDGCESYVEQMHGTIELAGRISEHDVPAEGRDRLVAAFRGWRAS